eukprot:COSAG02_NODE_25143_length_667_cov_21.505222_1_plen_126_part_01
MPRHSTGLGEVEGPGVEETAREGWRERGAAGITPGAGAAARGPEEALALARNVEGVAHAFVRHAAVAAVDGYIVAAIGRSWAFVELPAANRCRCSYSGGGPLSRNGLVSASSSGGGGGGGNARSDE